MTSLEVIRQQIDCNGGVISFADFMNLALYHPETGYYMNPNITIGEEGDFFTAPTLHPIFAKLVSRQIIDCWERLECPDPFYMQEWGAGNAVLAEGILQELVDHLPVMIHYTIVEKSPQLQEVQRRRLKERFVQLEERICLQWDNDEILRQAESFQGVILNNELFDALPVNRFIVEQGTWVETGVGYRSRSSDFDDIELYEKRYGNPKKDLDWLNRYLPFLDEGDRVDVSLASGMLIQKMTAMLKHGYILAFDYGDRAPDVYEKAQFRGNLRAYFRHTISKDWSCRVGQQDLTADVNFSLLEQHAMLSGARTAGFSTQAMFLEKLGFLHEVSRLQRLAFQDLKYDFELQTMLQLYVPTGLGEEVKVLAIAKGEVSERLRGFS